MKRFVLIEKETKLEKEGGEKLSKHITETVKNCKLVYKFLRYYIEGKEEFKDKWSEYNYSCVESLMGLLSYFNK